jgi:hypothetical protein
MPGKQKWTFNWSIHLTYLLSEDVMADREAHRKKEVVARALIDPAFRKVLFANPEQVFGRTLTQDDMHALERFKKLIPHLGEVVTSLSSDILCNHGGGGCGASVAV